MEKTAYVFSELDAAYHEGGRLSAQAQAFIDLELPELMARIPSEALVADFGCGTGEICRAMALGLPTCRVVGLDMDPLALEKAAQGATGVANLSFEAFRFGQETPPKGAPYDVAFTRMVLMHLPDPEAAIARMGSLLKPGGLLYLVDCDNRYDSFHPRQAWQDVLGEMMEDAQRRRGGSRRLGSRLSEMMRHLGFWPEGARLLYYASGRLGIRRWKEIFYPAEGGMAARDLQEMAAMAGAEAPQLIQDIRTFLEDPGMEAQIATWHAWSRKPTPTATLEQR
jgi:SAM-dependent methyltransferase